MWYATDNGLSLRDTRSGLGSTVYLKVLDGDGGAYNGGTGRWSLPTADRPGRWMPRIPDPEPCERGYHLCRSLQEVISWLGPTIYTAEAQGAIVPDTDKVAVESARLLRRLPWDERSARLLAVMFAERTLAAYEQENPRDFRPRSALRDLRQDAEGFPGFEGRAAIHKATLTAIKAVRWDFNGSAEGEVWYAIQNAAKDSPWGACAGTAESAASAAAARAARTLSENNYGHAQNVAWGDGWNAERDWQATQLGEALYLRLT